MVIENYDILFSSQIPPTLDTRLVALVYGSELDLTQDSKYLC